LFADLRITISFSIILKIKNLRGKDTALFLYKKIVTLQKNKK